ncbi:MAG TPA: copper homeostasis protein CutC, partial [Candidatus Acidoferrum sp.]|nr:copper homeostasis protein CutC [Candidatus Acidoferrum sp.]
SLTHCATHGGRSRHFAELTGAGSRKIVMCAAGNSFLPPCHKILKNMPTYLILEVAVDSLPRALAAERAGAHRLELCADLSVGGLTPGLELLRQVRSAVRIPIHAMVRPRPGDFVYSAIEFAEMKSWIKMIAVENVEGIVTGVLLPDGRVDVPRTTELVALASPMQVTFHRAFDETNDLAEALQNVILTGAHRILTSGGATNAQTGATILWSLIHQAANRITILPGGGLHPRNIAEVARATGARELHTGLGEVIPYSSPDTATFESAVRDCVANLRA